MYASDIESCATIFRGRATAAAALSVCASARTVSASFEFSHERISGRAGCGTIGIADVGLLLLARARTV